MNVFVPFSTQFPPRRTAVMRALPASEPEEGSVNPQAPMNSPVASLGRYFFFCASLAARKIWFEHSEVCAATMIPTEPSTRESSSMAVTYSTYPMPAPPSSAGKTTPSIPSLPSSLIVESGKSPASSHFRTFGAISRSANSRTLFLSCNCSSFSWKSTHGLLTKLHHTGHGQKELPPNAPVEVHSLHHRVLVGRSALTDRLDFKQGTRIASAKCFCGFPSRISFVHLRDLRG